MGERDTEKRGSEGEERRKSEKKRRSEEVEAERYGARIERALYSDKMILSIVNAAVGIAGL